MKTDKDICIVNRGKANEAKSEYEYEVYASTTEAVGILGEEKALKLLNGRVKTDARNAMALTLQGKDPSTNKLFKEIKALKEQGKVAEARALMEEFLGEPV